MISFKETVTSIDAGSDKNTVVDLLIAQLKTNEYDVVEVNLDKPWGAYIRINNDCADKFIAAFFPDLDPLDARLGNESTALSPKLLIVSPGQRLSWQYHYRRAERWRFLTNGSYNKSLTDEPGQPINAAADEVVQFRAEERHRLNGKDDGYVIVAEIWQHIDAVDVSDENDIVRLADDYKR